MPDIITACSLCEFAPVCRKQHISEKSACCNMLGQEKSARAQQAVLAVKNLYEKKPETTGFNINIRMHYAYDTPDKHNYNACEDKLLIIYKTDKIRRCVGVYMNGRYYFDDDLYLREIENVLGYLIL